jgi:hypothetical protein
LYSACMSDAAGRDGQRRTRPRAVGVGPGVFPAREAFPPGPRGSHAVSRRCRRCRSLHHAGASGTATWGGKTPWGRPGRPAANGRRAIVADLPREEISLRTRRIYGISSWTSIRRAAVRMSGRRRTPRGAREPGIPGPDGHGSPIPPIGTPAAADRQQHRRMRARRQGRNGRLLRRCARKTWRTDT